jgi:hypothetical protein
MLGKEASLPEPHEAGRAIPSMEGWSMRRRQDADGETADPEDPAAAFTSQDFSIDYELLAEEDILVVRLGGRIPVERLNMLGPMVRAHPGFHHRRGLVHDLTRVDPECIDPGELSALVSVMRTRSAPRGNRVAFVLPSDRAFVRGREFVRLAEGVQERRRHLARSLDEALAWMRATPH